jgi:SAM-dependent methyltransferase
MTIEAVRELATRLQVASGAYAALGAALDAHANGSKLDPSVRDEIHRLLAAHGADSILEEVGPASLAPVIAEIRATLYHGARLAAGPADPGWKHADAQVLRDQGVVSGVFPGMWKQNVVPALDGLGERLESGGVFLDVGVGIAAIAIGMARTWPSLRVVGVDLWAPALTIARENVRASNLEGRIELREQSIQDLPDRDAFDLAWLPITFIGNAILKPAVQRIHEALRPGGWLLMPCINPAVNAAMTSFVRLRTLLWGGSPLLPAEGEALLSDSGYAEVKTLKGAPNAFNVMVAARRRR